MKNQEIPSDTPSYLREALERAIKEYDQGIIKEKSAFENFANKYVIKGDPSVTPFEYFKYISKILKDFFKNNRNIKFSLVLVCLMERRIIRGGVVGLLEDKAYFHSGTHINLLSTDVKKITC